VLKTSQSGITSLPEQAGGLFRFYHDLLEHLPRFGVTVRDLVVGLS